MRDFVDKHYLKKNAFSFFYCTNVLETVHCGGNLLSELNSGHFEVHQKIPYKETGNRKKVIRVEENLNNFE